MKLWLFFKNMLRALQVRGKGLYGNKTWWDSKQSKIRNNLAAWFKNHNIKITEQELDKLAHAKTEFFFGQERKSEVDVEGKYASLWGRATKTFVAPSNKKASWVCDVLTGKCERDA